MTEEEWKARVVEQTELGVIHPPNPPELARAQLVRTFFLLNDAPTQYLLELAVKREGDLLVDAAADLERLEDDDFNLSGLVNEDARSIVARLFVRLRALDALVMRQQSSRKSPSDPDRRYLVEADPYSGYLIPRSLGRKGLFVQREGAATETGRFSHRALIHHRILPTRIGGLNVRLAIASVEIGRAEGAVMLGGGLFPQLGLQVRTTDAGFVVTRIVCDDHLKHAADRVDQAADAGCQILVYPELTVDPDARRVIQDKLVGLKPASKIPLVLAGTWHELRDDRARNTAVVYDGFGSQIATHDKIYPYDDNGTLEALDCGNSLTVLVADDALIGVAICRDFCERGAPPNPYAKLDVDLVLVASMGGDSTIRGHQQTAQDMRRTWRTEAFVVQQLYPADSPVLGHILAFDDDLQPNVEDLRSQDAWNIRPKG